MFRNVLTAPPGSARSLGWHRRRMLWAAVTGSGMLTGVYWTFPPIFAEAEPAAARLADSEPLVRTASLASIGSASGFDPVKLPDVPLTPSIEAHRQSITLLEKGLRQMQEVGSYTADFAKTEVVDGELTEPQSMALKVRHAPFSVYMKWTDGKPGQELVYVDGENNGEMLVKPSGLKGRILGTIKLDPTGGMALRESRHPVTEVGLQRLAEKILDYRYREASWTEGYDCQVTQAEVDGRPCHCFTIVYASPKHRADYRKSVIYIDRELMLPTKIQNFGWPVDDALAGKRLDEETLLESYCYTNIDFGTALAAIDFSAANEKYGLKRR